jgi:hypothetical protein
MRIRVSVRRNHLFGKTNTQKTVAKIKNLPTEEKPSFVYLCIVLVYRGKEITAYLRPDKSRNHIWLSPVSYIYIL